MAKNSCINDEKIKKYAMRSMRDIFFFYLENVFKNMIAGEENFCQYNMRETR